MIFDRLNELADNQSVAGTAGTALIGSQIDLTNVVRDIGNGQPLYLIITIDASILAASGGTIRFVLASDSTAAIAVDGSATEHWTSQDFVTNVDASNDLDAGNQVVIALPLEKPAYEQFLGLLVVRATATITAGSISAYLSLDPHGYRAYPNGRA